LHGFEKSALDFGGGSVDLVCEKKICKDRALMSAEFARFFVENFRAQDIGWEKVNRELDSTEVEVERLRDCVDEESLGKAWHSFQEEVAGGEESNKGSLNDHVLTDDDPSNTFTDIRQIGCGFGMGSFISGH
jgi:hypothetical protein